MLTHLRLERFKNFKDADLSLGSLTVLVGANASGKSNLRDAFRFLHGIARDYTLAEIIGQRYGESGEVQWRGIRGGTREIAYHGSSTFALEIEINLPMAYCGASAWRNPIRYRIEVEPASPNGPRVVAERFYSADTLLFDSNPSDEGPPLSHQDSIRVRTRPHARHPDERISYFKADRPVLSQIIEKIAPRKDSHAEQVRCLAHHTLSELRSMRFTELGPEAMRLPSFPGQISLGDRGENLSSVLQAMCQHPEQKEALLQWIRELTPMDVVDLEFPVDQIGRVLVTLVEEGGHRHSAYSASDGTLRFLATTAALLGAEREQFYFIEELENGIHPARLHLLLQLVEQQTKAGPFQLVATTHSPQVLQLVTNETLEYASLIYRLEGAPDARIKRILDIPEARRVLGKQDLSQLHAYGWLEDAVSFVEGQATAA